MGYHTWIIYGYGINLKDVIITDDAEKLDKFLDYAPEYKKKALETFKARDITEPIFEDYEELDDEYSLGIASVIKEVLDEYSGLIFTACENYDDHKFVMYCPDYPWNMTEAEKELTEEKLGEIMSIMSLIVENPEALTFGYEECENGSD